MKRTGSPAEVVGAVYDSYLLRVWRPRPGGLPARVDVEHVQSGRRLAVDADAFADIVVRLTAGFHGGPDPPRSAGRP